ncbi:hypothetical protein ESY86_19595 [Subsaximicrobium wynnwilliamsii]|uniref:Lipoprotein n=1 Tax=Subsaximicrobium wynnwilliamsii TaxID=291179 RepID=A0A5C6ZC51_9FLAO|nr:DUF5829 family protein [Subsaximicrobium wynnwilliamsii]TXD80969.1 hypothetical protein ESY87_19670 [Subsaximicrobium wynnwilliamsii]TXD86647.1 hypothetical protein ESY86_19595 [Subsaximicrobium wynnwilliamsii]TXE00283.1 hypothetical protein ESY88_19655 [Subsaximicrobium wynnwilliamsii]
MKLKYIQVAFLAIVFLVGCKQEKKLPEDLLIGKHKIQAMLNKNPNNVLFNHFYVVLDSSTYALLRSNTFLNEQYAGMDRGMPHFNKINDTVTNIYLRGETHYLEILGPNNSFKEPVGQIGIGFSLGEQQPFSLNKSPEFIEEGTKFLRAWDTASFTIKDKRQIWYKAFYTFGMKTNLYTWYSYYNPEFLEAIDGEKRNVYTREDFLKKAYVPEKLFKNVVSITLNCNLADQYRIGKELQLLGCTLEKKEGEDLIFKAGDIYIKLILTRYKEKSQLLQMETTLNREDNRTLKIGTITIKTTGKKSFWTFQ